MHHCNFDDKLTSLRDSSGVIKLFYADIFLLAKKADFVLV